MSKKTSRRKLLSGLSVGAAAALAGCSGIFGDGNGGELTPSDFDYPEGFSQEGIETFSTALGKESAHYQSDSFRFDSEYVFERPDGTTQELTAWSHVSGVDEEQYYYSENSNSVQEQYHDGGTVYLRLYSKQQEMEQFQIQEAPFSKEGAYLLTLFQDQIQGIDFSVDEVVSESRVRYVATLEDIPDDHTMRKQYNNLTEFELLLTIDTEGYVRRVEVDLSREVQGGSTSGSETSTISESYWFEFSEHGNVTVEEPDWTSEAEAAQESSGDSTSGDGTSGDGTSGDSTSGDDTTNSLHPPAGF